MHNSALYIYFTSLHVSGNHVPIIRRNCIYATLVYVTMYGWCLVCWLELADQTPPIENDIHQCRIDTVISPDDGHMVAPNM
jgi:hypothetical protein